MDAEKALELARVAYPNDENLRVAYMLGLNAGAEWMKKQIPMPEDTVIFQKGVEEGKKLMVEGAVEGVVWGNVGKNINISVLKGVCKCLEHDEPTYKVRIIVLPKEEEQ